MLFKEYQNQRLFDLKRSCFDSVVVRISIVDVLNCNSILTHFLDELQICRREVINTHPKSWNS